jgi:hypothetical protein
MPGTAASRPDRGALSGLPRPLAIAGLARLS